MSPEHADQLRSPDLQSFHASSGRAVDPPPSARSAGRRAILLESRGARETDFSSHASSASRFDTGANVRIMARGRSNGSRSRMIAIWIAGALLLGPCGLAHRLTAARRVHGLGLRVHRARHGADAAARRSRPRGRAAAAVRRRSQAPHQDACCAAKFGARRCASPRDGGRRRRRDPLGRGARLVPVWRWRVTLGFSSTVLAAKVLDGNRELRAVHGRVAIGILIVQDVVAVVLLALIAVETPSPYAFAVAPAAVSATRPSRGCSTSAVTASCSCCSARRSRSAAAKASRRSA